MVDTHEELEKVLKNTSPLVWTPAAVVQWLGLHSEIPEEMQRHLASVVEACCIDGEALCGAPLDVLEEWLDLKENERVKGTVMALVTSEIRSHQLVVPFITEELSSADKATVEINNPPVDVGEALSSSEMVQQALMHFHSYTKNSLRGGAPTVKRVWSYQPKITRRYYGSKIELLKDITPQGLGQILRYSVAVSAVQSGMQLISSPRSLSSKRVNPSR